MARAKWQTVGTILVERLGVTSDLNGHYWTPLKDHALKLPWGEAVNLALESGFEYRVAESSERGVWILERRRFTGGDTP